MTHDNTDTRIEELLRYDGEPPLGAPDELSDRYLVRVILEKADAPEDDALAEPPARSRVFWVAAALILAMAGGLVWWWTRARSVDPSPTGHATEVLSGKVVLASQAPDLNPGQAVHEGEEIALATGLAGVRLHPAVAVLLDGEDARMKVKRSNEALMQLHLESGRLFVHIDPLLPHPDVVVETRAGSVRVTGTVFEVRVEPSGVEVDVLRGTVELHASGRKRALSRGQGATLGGPGTRALSEAALARGTRRLQLSRSILSAEARGWLELTTSPPGAMVTLDGVVMGKTPLRARLRAGNRLMEVELTGYAKVREELQLEAGRQLSRRLLLSALSHRRAKTTWRTLQGIARATVEGTRLGALQYAQWASLQIIEPKSKTSVVSMPEPRGAASPRELLKKARAQRRERDWSGAAKTYSALVDAYPETPQGHAAMVALAHLQLERLGRVDAALASFEHYLLLAPRGALREEASFGRILALREMGRDGAAKEAMKAFMQAHPNSIHVFEIQEWLAP